MEQLRYTGTMCEGKETCSVLSGGVTSSSDSLLRSIITESDGFPDNSRRGHVGDKTICL